MSECKNCDLCDLITNECILNGDKCYKNGECLHIDCNNYVEGGWCCEEKENEGV